MYMQCVHTCSVFISAYCEKKDLRDYIHFNLGTLDQNSKIVPLKKRFVSNVHYPYV